ncbi:hypothetical protein [Wolbachia endosymbiont of Frankliniella intonsa]|uniref:hypothetical protein n=1 Tax=Wolbachia endosymbiont of Frankliniella intonsa TaxID=2902422 RepID=UPI00244EC1A3|nr:hypothetical protein [Wolbachia endosymbiont of Frankliniella intonsa]WGJ61987.1 hypothetical protein M3L71_07005 [Wolbachia endosymbiont of Frankliniella intonsa]
MNTQRLLNDVVEEKFMQLKGSVNVMCRAPYGYRYINKQMEGGQARFEVYEEEAEVVRKLFSWIGRERMSAGEVCRQLNTMSIMSAKGNSGIKARFVVH